jgi:hypothetical protein
MRSAGKLAGVFGLAVMMAGCLSPLGLRIDLDDDCDCDDGSRTIYGSGVLATETRSVHDFNAVALSGIGRLVIDQTGSESLTLTAEDNLLPLIEVEVEDGVLYIGWQSNANISPKRDITFNLTVDHLAEVLASGATAVEVLSLQEDTFYVGLSGATSMCGSGRFDLLEIGISGAAVYRGQDLAAREMVVGISGAASAIVNASEHLHGSVSGVASLRYLGHPTISVSVSGLATMTAY